ncbi:MerR family transcriptional regulator [Mumia sp. zg.B53]|uniref:MerR family transcriptional regulator n=1 Tax=unclassified Mumia TaxID=2621872 RepID=UPI001C6E2985|nr:MULTISPECIES: MerR family transcriptional regulator [unclassified Mumia]MBW9205961.1 MerR family transcriptional regulator [Mumia sp. zg.B17]MBW9208035.1 MerR family transcriptional regulator [Mumia sp. zg.B21]MBW9215989.1 MerR family transcriptional regulator [Mumia sp. zg.B53]MDD9349816.1 MerR family transcriptional regulator [Mumia sp.]
MSVRDVAVRLGVPAATLRTWERRYGLAPSGRSAGGHRRYSEEDVGRLAVVARLVADGMSPQLAVAAVRADPHVSPMGLGRAQEQISGELVSVLLAAAARGDTAAIRRHVSRAVTQRGVARAWDEVLVPLLQAVGERWRDPAFGIAGEHLTTEIVMTTLHGATARAEQRTRGSADGEVLLACAEEEQHSLPVAALEAALAEAGTASRSLGGRVPLPAMVDELVRSRPKVAFVWASMRRPDPSLLLSLQESALSPVLVLIGGPGWAKVTPPEPRGGVVFEPVADLPSAVERIVVAVRSWQGALVDDEI